MNIRIMSGWFSKETPEQELVRRIREHPANAPAQRKTFVDELSETLLVQIREGLYEMYTDGNGHNYNWSLSCASGELWKGLPGKKSGILSFEEYEKFVELLKSKFKEPNFYIAPTDEKAELDSSSYTTYEWHIRVAVDPKTLQPAPAEPAEPAAPAVPETAPEATETA
jgi:hypothetical protein